MAWCLINNAQGQLFGKMFVAYPKLVLQAPIPWDKSAISNKNTNTIWQPTAFASSREITKTRQ
jgi:hypothetical protein